MSAAATPAQILAGRIALVTGASRGIGAAVAKRLAAEGAHVVLTARTVGGLEEVDDAIRAEGGAATLVPLDLSDHPKIDQLGRSIFERFGRLDILVGNAGMLGSLGPVAHFDPRSWERVMALNVTANYRLIRSMDPMLRASDAGRAIFVTSGLARGVMPYGGAYAASKAALEMTVRLYASEVVKSNLRVNLLDPGVVRTKLRAQAFPGENPDVHRAPEEVAGAFVALASPECRRHGEIVEA
ncbi:SDR family NAD(P)-dependent oxidoreductase [Arenibaculum sp.]|jgi:NAD(P)-dependent dehydrogenase (short-subunit alcohol dehydrogenase family)|uniref:SDR family NAD(P)-dependent oxidoreductase n=1 Tax=Arenibaculum sp. TaxID=2865862 RepID=UPI002E0F4C34|nr:SDR family NAD(P)-dependent oxidoreductase [Arenibaculum sp.]